MKHRYILICSLGYDITIIFLLIIICIKTVKYVLHFIQRPRWHIKLQYALPAERLPSLVTSPKYGDKHAGSNYTQVTTIMAHSHCARQCDTTLYHQYSHYTRQITDV